MSSLEIKEKNGTLYLSLPMRDVFMLAHALRSDQKREQTSSQTPTNSVQFESDTVFSRTHLKKAIEHTEPRIQMRKERKTVHVLPKNTQIERERT